MIFVTVCMRGEEKMKLKIWEMAQENHFSVVAHFLCGAYKDYEIRENFALRTF